MSGIAAMVYNSRKSSFGGPCPRQLSHEFFFPAIAHSWTNFSAVRDQRDLLLSRLLYHGGSQPPFNTTGSSWPYLSWMTFQRKAYVLYLHNYFISKLWLWAVRFLMQRPPSFLDLIRISQLTRWNVFLWLLPCHMKFLQILSILFLTLLGKGKRDTT